MFFDFHDSDLICIGICNGTEVAAMSMAWLSGWEDPENIQLGLYRYELCSNSL